MVGVKIVNPQTYLLISLKHFREQWILNFEINKDILAVLVQLYERPLADSLLLALLLQHVPVRCGCKVLLLGFAIDSCTAQVYGEMGWKIVLLDFSEEQNQMFCQPLYSNRGLWLG